MKVVEHRDRRPSLRRERDRFSNGVVEPEACRVGHHLGFGRGSELWQQGGQDRAQSCRQLLLVEPEVVQDLHPRPQRRCALVVVAPAPAGVDTGVLGPRRQLVDEPRLADARLAFDECDANPAGLSFADSTFEARQGALPAHERRSP